MKPRKPIARRKPIRRVSKKRSKEMREYAKLRKEFLDYNPVCQVWLDENGFKMNRDPMTGRYESKGGVFCAVNPLMGLAPAATQVHHRAKRGKNYLNVSTWLAVCAENHERIENGKSWARSQGYLENI